MSDSNSGYQNYRNYLESQRNAASKPARNDPPPPPVEPSAAPAIESSDVPRSVSDAAVATPAIQPAASGLEATRSQLGKPPPRALEAVRELPRPRSRPSDALGVSDVERFQRTASDITREMGRVIVGQDDVIQSVLVALLAGSHVLLEGVPGLGKTRLVRALAQALDLEFARVQFTPDLMPADITGTNMIAEDSAGERRFRFEAGPIFANLILADEINRATPKTQAALLEAMAETQVTVAKTQHRLPAPFMVLATQNPIEMEGTYPLPEAQLDRFLFKVNVTYPLEDELVEIIGRTTSDHDPDVRRVASAEDILRMQALARQVPIAHHVTQYAARLVMGTHPEVAGAPRVTRDYVRFGASPRGGIALALASKIRALLDGRYNVAYDDIRRVAHAALRHRIILNFEADAEGITTDAVIDQVVMSVVPEELEAAVR